MKPRKKLPRSLRLAMIAGQFRQQRVDLMHAARRSGPFLAREMVREARAENRSMVSLLRAARRAYERERRACERACREQLIASVPSPSYLGQLNAVHHAAMIAHERALTAHVAELEQRLRNAGM